MLLELLALASRRDGRWWPRAVDAAVVAVQPRPLGKAHFAGWRVHSQPGWSVYERWERMIDNRPAQPAGPGRQVLGQPKHAADERRGLVRVGLGELRAPERGYELGEGAEQTARAACPWGTPWSLTVDTNGRR